MIGRWLEGIAPAASLEPGARAHRVMLLVLASAALWAVLEVVLGSRLSRRYDLMQVVWCRYATHLAIMVLLFAGSPGRLWRTRRPWLQAGRSFLMLVMPASFALSILSGANLHFVWSEFWIAPLAMLALAMWLLRERPPAALWACSALVLVAAIVVHGPRVPSNPAALVFPLVMALSFSLYVVATRALREEPLAANLFYTALVVFLLLTPYMFFAWQTPTLADAAILMGIGAVGLVSLALLDRSVKAGAVSLAAPVIGLEVVFAAVLESLDHGEAPGRRALLGVVILGAMLAWMWSRAASLGSAREAR